MPQTKGKTQLYATYKKPTSYIMTQTDSKQNNGEKYTRLRKIQLIKIKFVQFIVVERHINIPPIIMTRQKLNIIQINNSSLTHHRTEITGQTSDPKSVETQALEIRNNTPVFAYLEKML